MGNSLIVHIQTVDAGKLLALQSNNGALPHDSQSYAPRRREGYNPPSMLVPLERPLILRNKLHSRRIRTNRWSAACNADLHERLMVELTLLYGFLNEGLI